MEGRKLRKETAHSRRAGAQRAAAGGAPDVFDDAPPEVGLGDLDEELLQQQLQGEHLLTHLLDELRLPVEAQPERVSQEDGRHEGHRREVLRLERELLHAGCELRLRSPWSWTGWLARCCLLVRSGADGVALLGRGGEEVLWRRPEIGPLVDTG